MRQSTIPFPRQPWGFRSGPSYPEGWTFGLLIPRYKLASGAHIPDSRDRWALGSHKRPYWMVFDYTLQPQEAQDSARQPRLNFVALGFVAYKSQATKTFLSQFRQLVDDQGSGFNFSRVGVNSSNQFGSAARQLFLKRPYNVPNHLGLLNRVVNLAVSTDPAAGVNTVQLCIFGMQDQLNEVPE